VVLVLDDLSSGHAAAVGADGPAERNAKRMGEVSLTRGDIRDTRLVERLTRGVDAIVHLAAVKDAAASLAEPGRTFAVNVEGSRVLLAAAMANGVRHLVFSSSCAVYGTPTSLPVTEEGPLQPLNPYGESKVIVERMLPWFERAGGPRWVSLRYANAAGADPGGDLGESSPNPTNLVPLVMAALMGRLAELEIMGTDYPTPDGTAIRDYVHVADLADAHVRALDHLARGGRSLVCNLGSGQGASVREVISVAERVAGRRAHAVNRPRRAGDPAEVRVSVERAREVLGWQATQGLDRIITSAWRWHSSHPEGYATEARPLSTLS
jgi:UDP-glucose-4-epimerase GalE